MTSSGRDFCWAVLSLHGICSGTAEDRVYRQLHTSKQEMKLTGLFMSLACRIGLPVIKSSLAKLESVGLVRNRFSGSEQYTCLVEDQRRKALTMAEGVLQALDGITKRYAGSCTDQAFPLRLSRVARTDPAGWTYIITSLGIRSTEPVNVCFHGVISRVRQVHAACETLVSEGTSPVAEQPPEAVMEVEVTVEREDPPEADHAPVDDFLWMDTPGN